MSGIKTGLIALIDLRGDIWAGMFSWALFAGFIRALFLHGPDIPSGVLGAYGAVIGVYGVTKAAIKIAKPTTDPGGEQ